MLNKHTFCQKFDCIYILSCSAVKVCHIEGKSAKMTKPYNVSYYTNFNHNGLIDYQDYNNRCRQLNLCNLCKKI